MTNPFPKHQRTPPTSWQHKLKTFRQQDITAQQRQEYITFLREDTTALQLSEGKYIPEHDVEKASIAGEELYQPPKTPAFLTNFAIAFPKTLV